MPDNTPTLQYRPHTLAFREKVIETPALKEAFNALDKCRKSVAAGEPKGMFILGPSGAGKSTIAENYCKTHPPDDLKDRTVRPVIYARLKKGSDRSIMSAILEAAKDPAPHSGRNIDQMIHRLGTVVEACGTQLIFVDEAQMVLPEHSTTRAQIAADLFKSLIDELRVAVVLVGLPEASRLLQAQRRGDVYKDQLLRRYRKSIGVTPPTLESTGWERLVKAYQNALGVPCIALHGPEMLARLYLATRALPGRLSNLFTEALELTDGTQQIRLVQLAEAHEEAVSIHETPDNPFTLSRATVYKRLAELGLSK